MVCSVLLHNLQVFLSLKSKISTSLICKVCLCRLHALKTFVASMQSSLLKIQKLFMIYFHLQAKEGAVDVPTPVRPFNIGGTFVRPA